MGDNLFAYRQFFPDTGSWVYSAGTEFAVTLSQTVLALPCKLEYPEIKGPGQDSAFLACTFFFVLAALFNEKHDLHHSQV